MHTHNPNVHKHTHSPQGAAQPPEPCGPACSSIADERNHYFTGKYMTARDFAADPEYFLSRHRLHNRLLHDWGLVCGLQVVPHRNPLCRDTWVEVKAGIAIDCCGRELILCKDTAFRLPLPPQPTPNPPAPPAGKPSPCEEVRQPKATPEAPPDKVMEGPFLVCLRYQEDLVECVPVLYAEGSCDPARQEANRVRERAMVEACELEAGCWPWPGESDPLGCRNDCDDYVPGRGGGCLEPECVCGHMVPLALIKPKEADKGYAGGFVIDDKGRRHLPPPPQYLTHIVKINWPHGGSMKLADLREKEHGRLEIYFDRELCPPEDEATGINEHTFIVQYGGVQRDLEFLPSTKDSPSLRDKCVAVFEIEPSLLDPAARRTNIAGNVVYITLKANFVLDCHGLAVDGDHLKGHLPSGDGLAGGTFESWFRVTYD